MQKYLHEKISVLTFISCNLCAYERRRERSVVLLSFRSLAIINYFNFQHCIFIFILSSIKSNLLKF